jgi:hypothetical protein
MEAAGQILSSPALPSLDNDGTSITPIYGIVKIEAQNEEATLDTGEPLPIENHGTMNGQIAGLTFNRSGSGNLGIFAILGWAKVAGDLTSYTPKYDQTTDVRNISAETYAGAAGLTYRLIGDQKSTFAMGIFGGPAMIKSKSTSQIYHSAGITEVSTKLDINGYYLGLQFVIRLGGFRINPYLNVMGNPNPQCMKPEYKGDAYPFEQWNKCQNGEHGVDTFAVIAGSGINVGYGRFQFGLLQQGGTGTQALKAKPLIFSLRIGI